MTALRGRQGKKAATGRCRHQERGGAPAPPPFGQTSHIEDDVGGPGSTDLKTRQRLLQPPLAARRFPATLATRSDAKVPPATGETRAPGAPPCLYPDDPRPRLGRAGGPAGPHNE
ncbi:hypothetical protein CHELA1G11_30135 [Hyphomicrobiales bacterium]|nr:hypothetical protein CHELA1G2_30088 [Hyphomicrobiales bacterium]CAH1696277.1 hypothetical protein CHELA1G11_30135 [Hyphomicrobiales bacterium]